MPLQVPQLDDRDFSQILAEAVARIPVHTPEWNNFNDSDPGMTLVQLFAFMTENLLYRSNRIPEANRLKFLSLLGLPLRPATPARGLVAYTNDRGPVQVLPFDEGMELFAGKVPFRTRTAVNILPVSSQVFYKKPKTDLTTDEQTPYQNLYGNGDPNASLTYYQATPLKDPQAGQKQPPEVNIGSIPLTDVDNTIDQSLWIALVAPKAVPVDLARDVIAGETLSVGVYPSIWTDGKILEAKTLEQKKVESALIFDAALLVPGSGQDSPPKVAYKRLEIESAEDVLEMPGIIQLKLPSKADIVPYTQWSFDPVEEGLGELPPSIEDKQLSQQIVLWIRVKLSITDDTTLTSSQRGRISWLGINTARVIQALRVENERLGTGTGTPNQVLKVTNTPVIVEPKTETAPGQPPQYTFDLQVSNEKGQLESWRMTDDLYAEKPEAKVFALDPESGQVTFGDGLRGARPPRGAIIQISYEYGGGVEGRVKIAGINKASALPGGVKVANSVDTWGGSASETAVDGERRISSFLKHQDRLVTVEDFREITQRTPGVDIGRVEVLPLFRPNPNNDGTGISPDPGSITVVVVPNHDIQQVEPPDPTRLFLQSVVDWLEPRRLVTTQVFVQGPFFIPIVASLGIVVMPGYKLFVVQKNVKDAVRRYLSPLVGGPEITQSDGQKVSKGWQIENSLRQQDLAAAVSRVEGVRYVKDAFLGLITESGDILQQAEITIKGIQLPWLRAVDVQENTATPVTDLANTQAVANASDGVAVPLLPRKC